MVVSVISLSDFCIPLSSIRLGIGAVTGVTSPFLLRRSKVSFLHGSDLFSPQCNNSSLCFNGAHAAVLSDKPESGRRACTGAHSTANVHRAALPRDICRLSDKGINTLDFACKVVCQKGRCPLWNPLPRNQRFLWILPAIRENPLPMNIHSCHFRLAISLNHTQEFPAITFIESNMIGNQIYWRYSFCPQILCRHIQEAAGNAMTAICFFRIYRAHVWRKVFPVVKIIFNHTQASDNLIIIQTQIPAIALLRYASIHSR